jgi:hypothetical protein
MAVGGSSTMKVAMNAIKGPTVTIRDADKNPKE